MGDVGRSSAVVELLGRWSWATPEAGRSMGEGGDRSEGRVGVLGTGGRAMVGARAALTHGRASGGGAWPVEPGARG